MDAHIVTAQLDPVSQDRLNALRARHFPPERNHLQAHLTLFHAVPRKAAAAALAVVGDHGAIPFTVSGVQSLGRGVAYRIDAPALEALHRRLQTQLHEHLTPQDRQGLHPHVTVQNKVDPAVARALHDQLSQDFQPWDGVIGALALWRYDGGPWTPVGTFPLG